MAKHKRNVLPSERKGDGKLEESALLSHIYLLAWAELYLCCWITPSCQWGSFGTFLWCLPWSLATSRAAKASVGILQPPIHLLSLFWKVPRALDLLLDLQILLMPS